MEGRNSSILVNRTSHHTRSKALVQSRVTTQTLLPFLLKNLQISSSIQVHCAVPVLDLKPYCMESVGTIGPQISSTTFSNRRRDEAGASDGPVVLAAVLALRRLGDRQEGCRQLGFGVLISFFQI